MKILPYFYLDTPIRGGTPIIGAMPLYVDEEKAGAAHLGNTVRLKKDY